MFYFCFSVTKTNNQNMSFLQISRLSFKQIMTNQVSILGKQIFISFIKQLISFMGKQQEKKSQKQEKKTSKTKFYARQTLECLIFIIIMLLLQIPMIYLAASDTVHQGNPHPLDNVFDRKDYKSILKTLQSSAKKNRYIQIISAQDSGARQFLDHYASRNKENRIVFTRQYSNKSSDQIYSALRLVKNTLESQLELQQKQNKPRTWILIGLQKPVPQQDVVQIISEDPNDKIILLTSEKLQMEEPFNVIEFPEVTISKLKNVVESGLGLSKNQSKILVDYYQKVPNIFQNLNEPNFTIHDHLSSHYQNISNLNQKQLQILSKLCRKGRARATQDQNDRKKQSYRSMLNNLQNYGVILVDGQYYWKNQKYMLSYALQSHSFCEKVQISQQLIIKHIKQKTQREQQYKKEDEQKELFDFEEQEQEIVQYEEQSPSSQKVQQTKQQVSQNQKIPQQNKQTIRIQQAQIQPKEKVNQPTQEVSNNQKVDQQPISDTEKQQNKINMQKAVESKKELEKQKKKQKNSKERSSKQSKQSKGNKPKKNQGRKDSKSSQKTQQKAKKK